jgi:hypothetical protein
VGEAELRAIFANPRVHTERGWRTVRRAAPHRAAPIYKVARASEG